jgi:hypothetical protein
MPTEQLVATLRQAFPRYTVTMRAGVPIVGEGLATGVMIKPDGPGALKTAWAFPSMVTQILLVLVIFAGLLPGLTLFLIVWLATKGGVARIEQEVATVLAGGPSPQLAAGPLGPGAAAGYPPTVFTVVGAGACFFFTLSWLIGLVMSSRGLGAGSFSGIFWLALGVSALMVHLDEQRAHRTPPGGAPPGPWVLVGGIAAILLALSWVVGVIEHPRLDLFVLDTVVSVVAWIGAGAVLIMSHPSRASASPAEKPSVAMPVFGVVCALSSLVALANAGLMLTGRYAPGAAVVRALLGSLAWFVLTAAVLGRYFVRSGAAGSVAAPGYPQPQAYAPQGYHPPQQGYPPQGYYPPQQGYPQPQQWYPQPQQGYAPPQQGGGPPGPGGYPRGGQGPGQGGGA